MNSEWREEPVSPASSKGRRRLGRLRERLAWITARDSGYDRAEASALRWAIRLLEEQAAHERKALIEAHGSAARRGQS